jgi:hypothetical protein
MIKKGVIGCLIVIAGGMLILLSRLKPYREPINTVTPEKRLAHIQPDYSETTIPPNIAPLNFSIMEPGVGYCVKFTCNQSSPWEVFSRTPQILIPGSNWKTFLTKHQGRKVQVEILVKQTDNTWKAFQTWTFTIATEEIDGYLVYRRMHPTHQRTRGEIGIYYRNLTGFKESELLSSMRFENGCLNCHSFAQNRADYMLLGVRSNKYGVGTLLVQDGQVMELGTKFGYTSWHPSGRLAVYSANKLPMFYHASRNEARDTVNVDSWLGIYYPGSQTIATELRLSHKDTLENWPAWSADGKRLYFCSAPKLWPHHTSNPPPKYDQIRYDLKYIDYDLATNTWGDVHTLLSVQQIGKSTGMPHCSPDGRWLVVCLFDYGYFPSWKQESDLYLIDLENYNKTGEATPRHLNINSPFSESWQTWSSNSRWLVYSSKRLHGAFTRLFISYVDQHGTVHRPFVLPQKNPDYYESCLETFNTPELITSLPPITREKLAKVYRSHQELDMTLPITMATPTIDQAASWQGLEERE